MATHKALPLGGSAGLNFDVVGGTTAPTNPKDNTIWVNTSIPISKWTLSGKEPTSPATGQVLVPLVNSGGIKTFNALKKNTIDIQLSNKIKQWNGSSWKYVAGALYQGGSSVYSFNTSTDPQTLSASGEPGYNSWGAWRTSSVITVPEGFNTFVLDSYSITTVYGDGTQAEILIDGKTVMIDKRTSGGNVSQSFTNGATAAVTAGATVQTRIHGNVNTNISTQGWISVSITFHFE